MTDSRPPTLSSPVSRASASRSDDASQCLIEAAARLRDELQLLHFAPPVNHVYNPLQYAWAAHATYLARFGHRPKQIIFLGMNPGPFGMMQTGIPFGEVAAVRNWMGIETTIDAPPQQHPKRTIDGFSCTRSEVSGRRLWGWIQRRFGSAEQFFSRAIVINYCPLVFLEASGKNRTPVQLPASEQRALEIPCDRHLATVIESLRPDWLIGIGSFAEKRLRHVVSDTLDDRSLARHLQIGHLLHPSPANPAANRGWDEAADRQMRAYGLLPSG
ncbi:MAG: single-stranded DNA-binding protein [Lautropia sp.]|nr:single-stranded DNA-binding protein [Lautropia sp.]